jgi:hypothetical protein
MSNNAEVLLLAWNLFSLTSAKSAKIINQSNNGFTLVANISSKKQISKDYKFEDPSIDYDSNLKNLVSKNSVVSWPPEPDSYVSAIIIVATILANLSITFPKFLGQDLTPLKLYLLVVFRTESIAFGALLFIIITHILEFFYVIYKLKPIIKSTPALFSWSLLSLCIGLPATKRALKLVSALELGEKKK